MDGSGSMWGQIEGVNKIVIAREVVGEILGDFPEDQTLGLTVYGHRTKGDCSDIETMVQPSTGTAGQIISAVNEINPRGKTPMTDAVVVAAEALGYRDRPATVVLVSDGIETCNPDPCAAARALEAAGADFTAHVVGFDVNDAAAIGQLQCLAEETGGQFLSASTASELSLALETVAVAPPPEPEPEPVPEPVLTPVTFEAVIGDGGPAITDPVFWEITPTPEGFDTAQTVNPLMLDLEAGAYEVSATWSVAEQTVTANVSLLGADPRRVEMVFEQPLPTATLVAPDTAVAGSTIEIAWNGPDENNDSIVAGYPGKQTYNTHTRLKDGSPAELRVPSQPGTYELRYILAQGREVLATHMLEVTPAQATLVAPDTAIAGQTLEIAWEGPGYKPDYIAVAEPGSKTQINYTLTRAGSPLGVAMPVDAGTYELRYVMQQDRHILTSRTIEVIEVLASLVAPQTAVAGSTIEVAWDGPDYQNDFISVTATDDEKSINYAYTRDGAPAELVMPPEEGEYVIRYIAHQDRKVLASIPVTVTPAEARLVAPATAAAGADLEVTWEGPDYKHDYIAIAKPDEKNHEGYTYTRYGSPLELTLPIEPGEYELRYVIGQDRTVIARAAITLEDVTASLVAPAEAAVGSEVEVAWTGPDYNNDYIALSKPDDKSHESYTYTRYGSPLTVVMPTEPGSYELRYVTGQDRTVLATIPIELTEVGAALEAPDSAPAGSDIDVTWTGPDYKNDFIGISEPDDDRYETYTYTREGSPLSVTLPTEPGTYEIRYFVGQDRSILATRAIELTEVTASLVAPASAVVGQEVEIAWEGPDYKSDYVGVSKPDDDRYEHYTYVREGSPLTLTMPAEPGTYELRYYINQDAVILTRQTIEVADLNVTLIAPETATAASEIEVAHDGPGYRGDYLSITKVGADRYTTYTYSQKGEPATIKVPEEAGDYVVQYVMRQSGRVLQEVALTVLPQ